MKLLRLTDVAFPETKHFPRIVSFNPVIRRLDVTRHHVTELAWKILVIWWLDTQLMDGHSVQSG